MNAPLLDRHFALRKLHSLLGIVPIGAFLCFHLFENSLAVKGGDHFFKHVIQKIDEMPYLTVMEIGVIALPILFHALYGLWIWYHSKSNVRAYGYARNRMYWLQRITALITFAFIVTHVLSTRGEVLSGEVLKQDLFAHLADDLANPWILAWYIVGILSTVFHFCNGVWLALITWGATIGPRSQRISTWVCAGIGVILLALASQALRGFLAPLP